MISGSFSPFFVLFLLTRILQCFNLFCSCSCSCLLLFLFRSSRYVVLKKKSGLSFTLECKPHVLCFGLFAVCRAFASVFVEPFVLPPGYKFFF